MEIALTTLGGWLASARPIVALLTRVNLLQKVCVPIWVAGAAVGTCLVLMAVLWLGTTRLQNVTLKLQRSTEDSLSLSELFSSEIERLRQQLSQSQQDSASLDEILGSILQGGLPGHLEMFPGDYWCVRTMNVTYTDHEGTQRNWSQSGYHVNCFVPGGAKDIDVTFGVVGGAEAKRVDRSLSHYPYIYDKKGNMIIERFVYPRVPGYVRFELRGPSLSTFIARVTDMNEREEKVKRRRDARNC
eukprot:NODE_13434_length_1166_cov_4.071222.p1 GENE.NODE_13434_length_1166_cov_4.071222~~NODE_13434_length_1166_cov_4.071222.p1  ORF type:complete len:244 (-),score=31.75 NODE_13434_length_1166_cov_4.071222:258-989(-)